ncbi:DnaJ (Hsp40), sub C, member 28 [Chamberlinius hualienensis]
MALILPNEIFRIVKINLCRSAVNYKYRNITVITNEISDSYKLLDVSEDSDLHKVREAFILKAKQFHPDGGNEKADAYKFQQIQKAYLTIKQFHNQNKEIDVEDNDLDKDFDIKHTAPQHRQYLNFEGIGFGTPSQRQAQYEQFKVTKAIDAVHQRQLQKLATETEDALTIRTKQQSKKHIISNAIDRLAEDLIQQSMAKGEFDNLKGFGKPLEKLNHNPYIDTVTQKINEILQNEGFQPDWISLQKEIRNDIAKLREKLHLVRNSLGCLSPLSDEQMVEWNRRISKLSDECQTINAKIDNYNLKVPILNKQMGHFPFEKVANKLVK